MKLKEAIGRGEALLERIQAALSDISQTQLDMQKLEFESESSTSPISTPTTPTQSLL